MEVFDHVSDDGVTSLCGLREVDLPAAPLCPVCVAVEKRTRPGTGEIRTGGFVHREEPVTQP